MKSFLPTLLLVVLVLPVSGGAETKSSKHDYYTNSIGMKFKRIKAGSFFMGSCIYDKPCPSGSPNDKDAGDDEAPQHKVVISKDFFIGVYEVTTGQFKKFIEYAGRTELLSKDFVKANSHGDHTAVSYVSLTDANDFASWLNQKEGGNFYRLPTEAEWEYAARGGTTTLFSWGDDKSNIYDYAWIDGKFPQNVGLKKPNPWGLYDVHGNVGEWVTDKFHFDYYRKSPLIDPQGPTHGSTTTMPGDFRTLRGGHYHNHFPAHLRSAYRSAPFGPNNRRSFSGFRLVRMISN